jgi:acetate---CoA ligase (ADP-forming) subunit beta
MIKEIKGYALLKGFRGQEPVDIAFLEDYLLTVSSFVEHNSQIKELDLNPIFAYKDGAVAVDARIVLEPSDLTP